MVSNISAGRTKAVASIAGFQALLSADVVPAFPPGQFVDLHPAYTDQSAKGALDLSCEILSERIGIQGWFRRWIWPEIVPVDFSVDRAPAYFHGTSMPVLAEIMESGGRLSADITFVATEARFSRGYARFSARRQGGPGIVMAFEGDALKDALEATQYQPGMGSVHYRTLPRTASGRLAVGTFFQVTRDLPLYAQTDVSKMAVLNWLEAQRDAHDDKDEWSRWIDAWKHFSRID